jgi:hypothetical protein
MTYFFLKHHDEFTEYDQMIYRSMNKKQEEEGEKKE